MSVTLLVDGAPIQSRAGVTLAAAMLDAGLTFRTSVCGERRAPVCGMGICHECRVTVDGVAQRRACLVVVTDGMDVRTDA